MPSRKPRLRRPLVLVGMMGAGKTAIGNAVSQVLDVSFVDSDEALVQAAHMSIAEIFERDGEAFFRKREAEVIDRLLSDAPLVLSTGGGAFLQQNVRDIIKKRGISIWLKADLDLLWARVRHKDTRPLLRTDNPYETLRTLCKARNPVYALADFAVNAHPSYSIDDMTKEVVATLQRSGHTLFEDQ